MKIFGPFLVSILFSSLCIAQIIPINQNPKYNSQLDPRFNVNINPDFTSSINPKFTTDINPDFNTSLNPTYTPSVNPKFNTEIDPEYNSSLNPRYNSRLDPKNGFWEGMYLFDQNADAIGLLVRASKNLYLHYTIKKEWIGYFARAGSNFNYFTVDGKWTGQFLCSDSEQGYNLFDENAKWTENFVK
jgi:hypothetical protein